MSVALSAVALHPNDAAKVPAAIWGSNTVKRVDAATSGIASCVLPNIV